MCLNLSIKRQHGLVALIATHLARYACRCVLKGQQHDMLQDIALQIVTGLTTADTQTHIFMVCLNSVTNLQAALLSPVTSCDSQGLRAPAAANKLDERFLNHTRPTWLQKQVPKRVAVHFSMA